MPVAGDRERLVDAVLTANIPDWLTHAQAQASLDHITREAACDLGGLQELGPGRDDILERLTQRQNYGYERAEGGPPIIYDRGRYGVLKVRRKVLARAGFVGRLPGRRSRLGDSVATLVVLADDLLAEDVVLINAHLTAEVQRGKSYRTDLAHRLRVTRHQRETRTLGRIARRHKRKGRRVYLTADTNYDGWTVRGLVSCWDRRDGGTLGNRAVDVIAAPERAGTVQTIKPPHGDHKAVVATYRRKP